MTPADVARQRSAELEHQQTVFRLGALTRLAGQLELAAVELDCDVEQLLAQLVDVVGERVAERRSRTRRYVVECRGISKASARTERWTEEVLAADHAEARRLGARAIEGRLGFHCVAVERVTVHPADRKGAARGAVAS